MTDVVFLDGGFGTQLQARGLASGEAPEEWSITHPDEVRAVHAAYVAAGSQIVLSNTFGANGLKYHGAAPLEDVVAAAVARAREAGAARVALDVGPTGRLLAPAGDLAFDAAYAAFAREIKAGAAAGADLVFVETMGDALELKAAVLAARENCSLPVYATVALNENGKLLTGGDVACVATLLDSLGVAAMGFNCGLGPDRMLPFVEEMRRRTDKPVIVKPNAGMPRLENGRTVFPTGPEEFAEHVKRLVAAGASIVGGCCGTTPEHIRASHRVIAHSDQRPTANCQLPTISSGTHSVTLHPGEGLIIGERINPTGKKKLKEALVRGDTAYVMREAAAQAAAGAKVLDVNVGVPGLDEAEVLERVVQSVQSVTDLPIQIDTANPAALERALRHVNGKALINSVNGKEESIRTVLPLVKKYGGVVVALTLDENGIPETAEGRVAIAKRILARGREYGLETKDFVVDPLCMAVSAGCSGAVILESVKRITDELGVCTVLGVSNVSFGLPNRPALNATMLELAKAAGLAAAIYNPMAERGTADDAAADVILGRDAKGLKWIQLSAANATSRQLPTANQATASLQLADAICAGLREDAARAAEARLAANETPLAVIESGIVPALEKVGGAFERGEAYLPQLLMAADAAGAAFDVIRGKMGARGSKRGGAPIVLATVKGDIHDIGKNIVRALLENYGFDVIDLGRDVPPERIVEAVRTSGARLVGLSALMTTTVGAMAETIRQLHAGGLACKTCVGGAVVTADYAASIGADFYAKDAMATVRLVESLSL